MTINQDQDREEWEKEMQEKKEKRYVLFLYRESLEKWEGINRIFLSSSVKIIRNACFKFCSFCYYIINIYEELACEECPINKTICDFKCNEFVNHTLPLVQSIRDCKTGLEVKNKILEVIKALKIEIKKLEEETL